MYAVMDRIPELATEMLRETVSGLSAAWDSGGPTLT
jgi:hypothetical protein